MTADELLNILHERGWELSHGWRHKTGLITLQFMDPNKYPPEVRATWPADRFTYKRRGDPTETGRGWHDFTGPTLLDVLEQARSRCSSPVPGEGAA